MYFILALSMFLLNPAASGPLSGFRGIAADESPRVLARIDERSVTAEEFKERYIAHLLRTGMKDASNLRRAVLARLINEELIVAAARSDGIARTDAYRSHIEVVRKKLLIDLYIARDVLEEIDVSEEDLEEAFVRINTTLTARHLFARTEGEADALYQRLMSGESFETLARESFSDSALAHNGGSIGSFTFDEMDPDFEDAAYGLDIGEISKPVRTAHGFSIIQVTDRFTKPILTQTDYARRIPELRRFVLQKKQTQARSHFVRSLAEDLDIRFRRSAFDHLLGQITGRSLLDSPEAFLEEPLVSFEAFRALPGQETWRGDGEDHVWAVDDRVKTVDDHVWTVEEFRRRAIETDARHRASVRTAADLREFITGLVVRTVLLERAQSLVQDPELELALQNAMDAWILQTELESLELANEEEMLQYVAGLRRKHVVEADESAAISLEIAGVAQDGS